jgi:hypothetical protein
MTNMSAPEVAGRHRTYALRSLTRWLLAVVLVVMVLGSVWLAWRESAPAGTVPGVLVSVDHRDGGDGYTGLVTVRYVDGTGRQSTAQVVMTMTSWRSLNTGTPIMVYVRDGHAVDEPDPLLPTLGVAVLQAVILWTVLALAVRSLAQRAAQPDAASRARPVADRAR